MTGIFCSYRRLNAGGHAGHLYSSLSELYREDDLSMDLSIPPGADFVRWIQEKVGSCDILLAILGPDWAFVKDEEGNPRLHDPQDFARIEIEAGLQRAVPIIPVLVGGAKMPKAKDLPESIAPLSRLHGLELSDDRWDYDVNRLFRAIERLTDGRIPTVIDVDEPASDRARGGGAPAEVQAGTAGPRAAARELPEPPAKTNALQVIAGAATVVASAPARGVQAAREAFRRRRDRDRAPPEAPEVAPEPIRRTPHIDLSARPPLVSGQVFTALVFADTSGPRRGETAERIVLAAPPDVEEVVLDVWLVTTSHFEIIDSPIKSLTIRRDEPRSDTVAFGLAVKAAPRAGEEPLVSASFSYNGRPSGKVTLIVASPEVGLPAAKEAPGLVVDVEAVQPDLTVEISSLENDGRSFEVRLDTPVMPLARRTETWRLSAESPRLVAETMARFFDDQRSANERLASLRGAGLEFFDAAPPLFKETYWRLIDGGYKLRNLYVVSDERSIPWELMIPIRRTAEGVERRSAPLGVELAVGRWHRQTQISPRQRLALKTSYVVAPRYEGGRQLAASDEEARFVCEHFNGERIQPARFDNLEAVLAEQGADLLHFACHGEADRGGVQVLLLEDTDTLDPQQIRAMRGLERACRKHKPLVFLNACELGRPVQGLIGASGFARSFIELDASGVIGTLWSVDDRTAHDVAIEFYQQLIDDPATPFAEALRKIRAKGFDSNGMDTYAAYCFYGDPSAGLAPDP